MVPADPGASHDSCAKGDGLPDCRGGLFLRGLRLSAIVVWLATLLLALSLSFPTLGKHTQRTTNGLCVAAVAFHTDTLC